MWTQYNPNPVGRNVEDCAIRAVTKALDWNWDRAYATICAYGYGMGDMPHSNSVWGAVLRENGFIRKTLPDECPDCYTAEDFCMENPQGTFVLGFGRHVATVVDGNIFDSWDSTQEIPQYYWKKEGD